MRILSKISTTTPFGIQHLQSNSTRPFLLFSTKTSNPDPSVFINYLIDSFAFSKPRAIQISNRFSWKNFPENQQSVLNYFKKQGFTQPHIRSLIAMSPQLLFTRIDKTLNPKLQFFHQLGLVGSDLGEFISKGPSVITGSLTRKFIPCTQILKSILIDDYENVILIRVVKRCPWIISHNPQTGLLLNVEYLRKCGIVGSQLSMLLIRQPGLFIMRLDKLKALVSRVLKLGFSIESRMFVHALLTVSSISEHTLKRKMNLFLSYGFSEDEFMVMFRKAPLLPKTSEEKLKLGIEFCMNTLMLSKETLVGHPTWLMFSFENRVIPRYTVLQVLMSKRLLKREPSYLHVLFCLTDEKFMHKFISCFTDDALELLKAYKGHLVDSEDGVSL